MCSFDIAQRIVKNAIMISQIGKTPISPNEGKNKYEELSSKVARLRDVFPWDDKYDIDQGCDPSNPKAWHLAEIVHSPEYCIDAMIRHLTA